MSTVIANPTDMPEKILPWYRYGWPWFLISIPLISMMLGSVMLYLALNANNSLVVDDYYKEGKAYNLRIERDRAASLLGLEAVVGQTAEGLIMQLTQTVSDDMPESLLADALQAQAHFTLPEAIHVRWVHVTQAERDGEADLQFIGAGRYVAPGSFLPDQGKYRLHVQPLSSTNTGDTPATENVSADWRLISSLTAFTKEASTSVPAPKPEKVFNKSLLQ